MPVKLIPCRNSETGATAEVPETALIHMSNWVPTDQGDSPAAEGAAADITSDPDVPTADDADGKAAAATATTRKSKAAKATTSTTKED